MWQGFSMASGGNTGYSPQAVLKTFTISSSTSLHSAQALCFPFSTISVPHTCLSHWGTLSPHQHWMAVNRDIMGVFCPSALHGCLWGPFQSLSSLAVWGWPVGVFHPGLPVLHGMFQFFIWREKKVKNSSINYIKILTQCFKNPVFSFFPFQSYPLTKIFFFASFIWIPVPFQRKEESPDMAYYLRYRSYFLHRTLTFWLPLSFLTSYGFSK